jgi:hypothetical protein
MSSSTLPGCTVVEDTQGLFKKHREEELKERKKLYRLVLLPCPKVTLHRTVGPLWTQMPDFISPPSPGGVIGRMA